MTTSTIIIGIFLIWIIEAVAVGLTAIALVKDNQAAMFITLTVVLAVISVAATWRLLVRLPKRPEEPPGVT